MISQKKKIKKKKKLWKKWFFPEKLVFSFSFCSEKKIRFPSFQIPHTYVSYPEKKKKLVPLVGKWKNRKICVLAEKNMKMIFFDIISPPVYQRCLRFSFFFYRRKKCVSKKLEWIFDFCDFWEFCIRIIIFGCLNFRGPIMIKSLRSD